MLRTQRGSHAISSGFENPFTRAKERLVVRNRKDARSLVTHATRKREEVSWSYPSMSSLQTKGFVTEFNGVAN